MPIRASERGRYPSDWAVISARIRGRAGGGCEGIPGSACQARHGERHPLTGAVVVLTVAHLDHQPENCADENLRALCQRCHNRYDQPHRQRNAALTRRQQKRNLDLFIV